ncbi:hypothetical protein SAY86_026922 [Trapa natans]|uniref:Uncharacterized protein n=1 Tax=Trapa natans TaxID=22666 RepID=A0AAN7KTE7_TRANT|nr:hypothetical protein SAY86_026922 [Trapa natans]
MIKLCIWLEKFNSIRKEKERKTRIIYSPASLLCLWMIKGPSAPPSFPFFPTYPIPKFSSLLSRNYYGETNFCNKENEYVEIVFLPKSVEIVVCIKGIGYFHLKTHQANRLWYPPCL